jgi:hypothetical protein
MQPAAKPQNPVILERSEGPMHFARAYNAAGVVEIVSGMTLTWLAKDPRETKLLRGLTAEC